MEHTDVVILKDLSKYGRCEAEELPEEILQELMVFLDVVRDTGKCNAIGMSHYIHLHYNAHPRLAKNVNLHWLDLKNKEEALLNKLAGK